MKLTKYPYPVWPWQQQQGFPWPRVQFQWWPEPFALDSGAVLPNLLLAYEEWGQPDRPTIVVFHALTGDSHVARHTYQDHAGWWDGVVGYGKAIDLHQYHVVASNVLGGAMGTTGPSSLSEEGTPYGGQFPNLSLFDMVRAQHRLIETLSIPKPYLVVGGSMGGMMALAYGALYPDEVSGVLAIGAPISHSPWAIAYHTVGKSAILADEAFLGGHYYLSGKTPETGLALARMADMISYQSPESMQNKFGRHYQTAERQEFQVASYLRYQGQKILKRFDANTYLRLTEAMDRFDLADVGVEGLQGKVVWMIGIQTDMLYPWREIQQHAEHLRLAGVNVHYETLMGIWGHDTFLVDQAATGKIAARFLKACSRAQKSSRSRVSYNA